MRSDIATEFFGSMDCTGELAAVLERIPDTVLEKVVADGDRGPAAMLFTVRMMQSSDGGITTTIERIQRLYENALLLLTLESMRRGGFIVVESLPKSLGDEKPFAYHATASGRERFKILEANEAREKAANAIARGKDKTE